MTQENDQWKRRYILWQLAGIPGDPDNTAQTDRTGGITQLPDPETLKKNNMVHKPLLGPGLPSFVETYIWWATAPADEHFPPRKELEAWINRGRLHLGNTEEETRQLLRCMQENPLAAADYLDAIWVPEHSKLLTEPFRNLAQQNQLWQFDL